MNNEYVMTQLNIQQNKYKLTGSSVIHFKPNKKKFTLSVIDELFMLLGILFLFYLLIITL